MSPELIAAYRWHRSQIHVPRYLQARHHWIRFSQEGDFSTKTGRIRGAALMAYLRAKRDIVDGKIFK